MKRFSFSRQWERIRTVPGLGRDVGLLIGITVVGLVAVVLIQGNLSTAGLFEQRGVVKVEFGGVPGVNPASSNRVTIAGVPIGRIDAAETTDRGTAVLTLDIEAGHEIFDNARAVLRPKNPLNEMSVELNPGGPPGAPLGPDDVLPMAQTERPVQADEVLGHLDERTQIALTSLLSESDVALARAPQELPGGLQASADTMTGLRPVAAALQTRRDLIAELVSALSQISVAAGANDERTARLVSSTQRTLGVIARNDDALRDSVGQLPGLSEDLRSALTASQRLTEQLDPTLDNLHKASEALPPALSRVRDTVGELDRTVEAAGPVVSKALPVVADLRPLVDDVDVSLHDLTPVTAKLPKDTAIITSYLTEIRAFVYNTRSVFGAGDSLGRVIRGHVTIPSGAMVIPQEPGYAPGPENGLSDNPPNPEGQAPAEQPSAEQAPIDLGLLGGL